MRAGAVCGHRRRGVHTLPPRSVNEQFVAWLLPQPIVSSCSFLRFVCCAGCRELRAQGRPHCLLAVREWDVCSNRRPVFVVRVSKLTLNPRANCQRVTCVHAAHTRARVPAVVHACSFTCDGGRWSNRNRSHTLVVCAECLAGRYSAPRASECAACEPGKVSAAGQPACTQCAAGLYPLAPCPFADLTFCILHLCRVSRRAEGIVSALPRRQDIDRFLRRLRGESCHALAPANTHAATRVCSGVPMARSPWFPGAPRASAATTAPLPTSTRPRARSATRDSSRTQPISEAACPPCTARSEFRGFGAGALSASPASRLWASAAREARSRTHAAGPPASRAPRSVPSVLSVPCADPLVDAYWNTGGLYGRSRQDGVQGLLARFASISFSMRCLTNSWSWFAGKVSAIAGADVCSSCGESGYTLKERQVSW